jgi:hypothetical protein
MAELDPDNNQDPEALKSLSSAQSTIDSIAKPATAPTSAPASGTPDAVQKSMDAVAGAPTQSKDAKGNPLYTDKAGMTYDASGKSLTPESSDAELDRWLRIARGQ